MDTIDIIQGAFPNLKDSPWEVTSDPDKHYNCIAWAIGITTEWWWPSTKTNWPAGVPMELTIEAFAAALATKGFEPCDRADLETGIEKVAVYARAVTCQPTPLANLRTGSGPANSDGTATLFIRPLKPWQGQSTAQSCCF